LHDGTGGRWNSPSIDRIDHTKGHTPDTCVIVSWVANTMKSDCAKQDYTTIVKLLRSFHDLRQIPHDYGNPFTGVTYPDHLPRLGYPMPDSPMALQLELPLDDPCTGPRVPVPSGGM
jgi:hypothetical protein